MSALPDKQNSPPSEGWQAKPDGVVPKLRFPEFCSVGEWVEKRIVDLFNPRERPEKATSFDSEKIITVKLHANGVIRNEKTSTLTGGTNYFKRRAGEFIFSKIDLLNGAFGLVPDELDGFCSSSDIPAFSFKERDGSIFFINWLKANYQSLKIERTGTSNTLKRISPGNFLGVSIWLPSIREQQKIADCLSSIDELITAQTQKIGALKTHKKALMGQLFPAEGETVPRLRFADFKEMDKWKKYKVSSLLKRVSNPVNVNLNEIYRQIGIRSHGKGIFHKEPVSGEELGKKRVFWVQEDSFVVNIVFAWEQAVAKTSLAEKGMIASHRFPMYKAVKNKSDIHYMLYFFLTKKGKNLLSLASPGGAGRNKTLGQKEFENLEFLLPENVEEQTRIANFLSSVDELITAETQKLEALKAHKKGLMQQLFPSADVRE